MEHLKDRYLDQAQQQGRFSRQKSQFYITTIRDVSAAPFESAFSAEELTSARVMQQRSLLRMSQTYKPQHSKTGDQLLLKDGTIIPLIRVS